MKRPFLSPGLSILACVIAACGEAAAPSADPAWPPADGSTISEELPPCAESSFQRDPDASSLTVEGVVPPCRLEFREVARLRGEADGRYPRPPIALAPNGGYVSATYDPGEVAVWSADGRLSRTIGRGPGGGPGEFRWPLALVVDADRVVNISAGQATLHRYDPSGDFMGSFPLHERAPGSQLVIGRDGALVFTARGPLGLEVVTWRPGDPELTVLRAPRPFVRGGLLLAASEDGEVWLAEPETYAVHRIDLATGMSDLTVRREAPWFLAEGSAPAQLSRLAADRRGLVWMVSSAPAPDAPSGPLPEFQDPGEALGSTALSRYRDNRIEVVSSEGHLVASRVFEDVRMSPTPITARFWYLEPHDEPGVILILVATLEDP